MSPGIENQANASLGANLAACMAAGGAADAAAGIAGHGWSIMARAALFGCINDVGVINLARSSVDNSSGSVADTYTSTQRVTQMTSAPNSYNF